MAKKRDLFKEVNALRKLLSWEFAADYATTDEAAIKAAYAGNRAEIKQAKKTLTGIWIPLEVSFPPTMLDVLLALSRKGPPKYMLGYWHDATESWPENMWMPSTVRRDRGNVTHWMIIPPIN